MGELLGILAAVLSSTIGGTSAAVTRYAITTVDPITLAAFRFGGGFLVLLPIALAMRRPWPKGHDWIGVGALGVLFYAVFCALYNLSLAYTTAARGTLALAALPLLTMAVAAVLGVERLTLRKTLGVLLAVGGVAIALAAGLEHAPETALRGDLIMAGGALCMALYSIWSRPFIARSDALTFLTGGMGVGGAAVAALAWAQGGFTVVARFGAAEWLAMGYLAAFGGAATFFLWVWALRHTTPTRVTATITVNPIAAALLAVPMLGEPVGIELGLGILAVLGGIWIASTQRPAS
jgi:drug/metabolite transporter (DMT)-like permease